jgi:hypothetical protein
MAAGNFFGWYVPAGGNLCVSSTDLASVTVFYGQQYLLHFAPELGILASSSSKIDVR